MNLKIKNVKKAGTFVGCMMAILVVLAACGISWICTCGVVKLITMCFGWTFSWGIATGVWLIMYLARSVFNHTITVKK